MIWGVMAGKILINLTHSTRKTKFLGLAGVIGIIMGYAMDWLGLSPINKHISSSSFVIASGGWCFVTLVLCYWMVDVKHYRKWVTVFAVVGMNPIFIYVFSRTVGRSFMSKFVSMFTKGFMNWVGLSESIMNFTTFIFILGLEWYICYWLYKKKIFIKI
jgi:predicted acyltransferase